MNKWLLVVFVVITGQLFGQSYYNEWIDYNKTYYKFKIGSTGVYRINSSELAAIGLGNEGAQNFQLWRNGKQVVLYTSAANGPLDGSGYIEFWGERNDGVTDRDLYRVPGNQLSDRESLLTDTAAFFLTVNPAGNNLRFSATDNNVSGNTIPAEPYFIYSIRKNFKDRIHRGRALVAGSEYVYSSTYDIGELWSTRDIYPSTPVSINFNDLHVSANGPAATFRAGMAGSSPNGSSSNGRRYSIELNNTSIIDTVLNQFDSRINYNSAVPISAIANGTANFKINNKSVSPANPNDRIVCNFIELNYPRQFNFGNQSTFAFSLPASASAKYLEIRNFNSGGSTPVLYDMTNLRRYVANVSTAGIIQFVVLPSSNNAILVLVSQNAVCCATRYYRSKEKTLLIIVLQPTRAITLLLHILRYR